MSTAPASAAIDLDHGRLWLLGGVAPATSSISWLPPGADGYESLNSYALVEEDGALLIDTGVALHSSDLVVQLDAVVGRTKPLGVYLTRLELDCIGGLGQIAEHFNLTRVYAAGFAANPFEFFDDMTTQTELEQDAGYELVRRQHGETVTVARGRDVEVIRPMLRLLATSWVFDERTGTLFTSDAFGHVRTGDHAVRRAGDNGATATDAGAHLLTKFDWIRHAQEPAYLAAGVERVFAERDVRCIAPAHGCVIQGPDLVERHKHWVIDAIRSAGDS